MKTYINSIISILFMGMLLFGVANANTADGETPSVESVCNNESGSAFGLCNAYCEAMDCHLDAPNASATACEKVGDKFAKVTGRTPPCEVSNGLICPCWDDKTIDELAELVEGDGLDNTFCINNINVTQVGNIISGVVVGSLVVNPGPLVCNVVINGVSVINEFFPAEDLDDCKNEVLSVAAQLNIPCTDSP